MHLHNRQTFLHQAHLACLASRVGKNAGYESRLVTKGFLPQTEEDRILISPPQRNLDSSHVDSIDELDKWLKNTFLKN